MLRISCVLQLRSKSEKPTRAVRRRKFCFTVHAGRRASVGRSALATRAAVEQHAPQSSAWVLLFRLADSGRKTLRNTPFTALYDDDDDDVRLLRRGMNSGYLP